jgi:hypothetical protein
MNNASASLACLPLEEARVKAREIGRTVPLDATALKAAWPEFAGHFVANHVTFAPDEMSDDEFDVVMRDLLAEYRRGIEESSAAHASASATSKLMLDAALGLVRESCAEMKRGEEALDRAALQFESLRNQIEIIAQQSGVDVARALELVNQGIADADAAAASITETVVALKGAV